MVDGQEAEELGKQTHKLKAGRFYPLKSSVVRTLSGGFLLVMVPVLCLSLIAGTMALQNLKREIKWSYQSSLQIISDQMNQYLTELQTKAGTYLVDDDVIQLTAASAEHPDLWPFAQFYNRMKLDLYGQSIQADVTVVFPQQSLLVSSHAGVLSVDQVEGLAELTAENQDQVAWMFNPALEDPQQHNLSVVLGYFSSDQTRPYIFIEITEDTLAAFLGDLFSNSKAAESVYFIDPTGLMIQVDQQQQFEETQLLAEQKQKILDNLATEAQTGSLHHLSAHLPSSNCVIGLSYDERELLRPMLSVLTVMLLLLLAAIGLSVLYLLAAHKRVYEPVRQLLEGMDQAAAGDFQARVDLKGRDEFALMAEQFNHMIHLIDELMKHKYISEVELKKAQLKFLQSQINPHFLYNSLFSLYNLIESDETEEAAQMALYLGKFYRLGAGNTESGIPLRQEIANIEIYLKIYQLRYGDQLIYQIHTDSFLDDLIIPSLSLQTLIENVMTHAFNEKQSVYELTLTIAQNGEQVVFSIQDNGSGLTEDRRTALNAALADPQHPAGHGLGNVIARLRLMYDSQVRMEILPVLPHGTLVRVWINQPGHKQARQAL